MAPPHSRRDRGALAFTAVLRPSWLRRLCKRVVCVGGEGCSHIMCHTCAYGLWCCPQCRVEVPRPCPTCRRETYFDELEGDRDADKVASAAAKSELDSAELAQWRQRKKDGQALSARTKKDSVQAMQLALQEEKVFVLAVVAS